jgi:dephospho-CoA kinase
MRIVIGVTGKLGSGKDYITNHVIIPVIEKIKYRYLQFAFADQIKVNVMTKNNISYNDVYENKTPESRQLLQNEGTEVGRMQDRNIWVKYMDNWMNVHENRGVSLYIISDVRFKNEYEFVKNNKSMGIIVKVVAPKRNEDRLLKESRGDEYVYQKISSHASECDLDDYNNDKYDMVIENDTTDIIIIEELQYKFERLLYDAYLNLSE